MAEFLDSFDDRATVDLGAKYNVYELVGTASLITLAITSAAGRNGSSGLQITRTSITGTTDLTLLRTLPAAARYKIAFARRWSGFPPSGQYRTIASVRDGGTIQCSLRLNDDGTLEMVRGTTAITGGKTTFALSPDVMNHFEWDVTVHNTAGAGELRINETPRFSFTGQNTRMTTNNQITEAGLRMAPSDNGDRPFTDDIDDLIIHDQTAFIGDLRVDYRRPTGVGTHSEWSAVGAGTLWEAVDDVTPDGDATYASATTIGQKQTFQFDNVPTSVIVKFVQHVWVAKKTDAGTRQIARRTKSGVTESNGATIPLSTDYEFLLQMENTDPATGIAWTPAGFNNAEFGDEIIS